MRPPRKNFMQSCHRVAHIPKAGVTHTAFLFAAFKHKEETESLCHLKQTVEWGTNKKPADSHYSFWGAISLLGTPGARPPHLFRGSACLPLWIIRCLYSMPCSSFIKLVLYQAGHQLRVRKRLDSELMTPALSFQDCPLHLGKMFWVLVVPFTSKLITDIHTFFINKIWGMCIY